MIDANAAMAFIAGILAEQRLGRRVVQVDIERVGEVDLDCTERVLLTGAPEAREPNKEQEG